MKKVKTVKEYLENSGEWKEGLTLLRGILRSTKLEETIKWGAPVYTLGKKNVVGIGAFQSYAGLWFFQGALLKDRARKLINAQEGVTKALRQWRFQSINEIRVEKETIRNYIEEAIANQEQGKEIKPDKNKPLIIPEALAERFQSDPQLKNSFEALSLSKKRDYAEYISMAKREDTQQRRLEKIIPMILEGMGMNDKYKK